MRLVLATVLLGLAALPDAALAQQPSPTSPSGLAQPAPGVPGHRQPRPDGAGRPDATGRPDGVGRRGEAAGAKVPSAEESARKSAARDKAWDAKMKRTLGSICSGC
ncbi:hypothetical protein [Methylobacterium sp. JK268]